MPKPADHSFRRVSQFEPHGLLIPVRLVCLLCYCIENGSASIHHQSRWVRASVLRIGLLQSITNNGVKRCYHTHVLHGAYSSQLALCRWVCASTLRSCFLQSITNNGVKRCCHTHVLHSAYSSQFALCRWVRASALRIFPSSGTTTFLMPFVVDDFWVNASGGASFMATKVGYPAYVLEFVYQKYLNGCRLVTERGGYVKPNRVMLWVAVAYFKQHLKVSNFDTIAPRHKRMGDRTVRHLVRIGVTYLNGAMREISESHFTHPPVGICAYATHGVEY